MSDTYILINGQNVLASSVTLPTDRDFRDAWVLKPGNIVQVDWELARTNWRKQAKLTRIEFLAKLVQAGILPQSEALEAGKGDWPATFSSAISELGAEESFEAQLAWATAQEISRNHPLIETLRGYTNLTQEQVDAMFGYTGQ